MFTVHVELFVEKGFAEQVRFEPEWKTVGIMDVLLRFWRNKSLSEIQRKDLNLVLYMPVHVYNGLAHK